MTKEELLFKTSSVTQYDTLWYKEEEILKAMEEYAKYHSALAFEAGVKYANNPKGLGGQSLIPYPKKEEYLSKTFNNEC